MVSRVNQQAIDQISYRVQIVKSEVVENTYAMYLIKVIGPNNISFHINDRYSSIRGFYNQVKDSLPN